MKRTIAVLSLCFILSGPLLAQAKTASKPTLQETLDWMDNFSGITPLLPVANGRLPGPTIGSFLRAGISAIIDTTFRNAKETRDSTRRMTGDLRLGVLNVAVGVEAVKAMASGLQKHPPVRGEGEG